MPELTDVFDPRFTLARPDLAAQALEGVYPAQHFVEPDRYQCTRPTLDIHARAGADADADRLDELLWGERFDVLEIQGDWAWGQAARDGVVGWVQFAALATLQPGLRQRIARAGQTLPLNALVDAPVEPVRPDDLAPMGDFANDPVAVAESLLGVAHRLGGRSSLGTDCAGLVQQCLLACGRAGPRYADQQAQLGQAVGAAEHRRGDLVVWLHSQGGPGWSGHVAWVLDAERLIHATGYHGAVVIEALAEADARYRADGFEAPVVRRLSPWG